MGPFGRKIAIGWLEAVGVLLALGLVLMLYKGDAALKELSKTLGEGAGQFGWVGVVAMAFLLIVPPLLIAVAGIATDVGKIREHMEKQGDKTDK